jgi:hypothetical protein
VTATAQFVRHEVEHADFRHCMEALRYHGFTVTFHSPGLSPGGLYAVTAYGSTGRRPEMLRAAHEHLDGAIRAVAVQLGGWRLKAYAKHVLSRRPGGDPGGPVLQLPDPPRGAVTLGLAIARLFARTQASSASSSVVTESCPALMEMVPTT